LRWGDWRLVCSLRAASEAAGQGSRICVEEEFPVQFQASRRDAIDGLAAYPGLPPCANLLSSLWDGDCARWNIPHAINFGFKRNCSGRRGNRMKFAKHVKR
jgi:hypothetical protein